MPAELFILNLKREKGEGWGVGKGEPKWLDEANESMLKVQAG